MNKKVLYIILVFIFIMILVLISLFLNKQNQNMLAKENISSEQVQIIDKEENKMEVTKVDAENFEREVLESKTTVLVDFYADWCGPCKMLSPIVDEVATSGNTGAKFVKVNIDENQDLARKYNVMSIPTLVIIKNGKEADRSVGLINKEKIENLVK